MKGRHTQPDPSTRRKKRGSIDALGGDVEDRGLGLGHDEARKLPVITRMVFVRVAVLMTW